MIRFRLGNRMNQPGLEPATWQIKITQIEVPYGAARSAMAPAVFRAIDNDTLHPRTWYNHDSWLRAPNGCTQYFPHTEGIVETFNYNGGSGPYLSNLDYAICFRRQNQHTKMT